MLTKEYLQVCHSHHWIVTLWNEIEFRDEEGIGKGHFICFLLMQTASKQVAEVRLDITYRVMFGPRGLRLGPAKGRLSHGVLSLRLRHHESASHCSALEVPRFTGKLLFSCPRGFRHVTRASPGAAILGLAFLAHTEPSTPVCLKSKRDFLASCCFVHKLRRSLSVQKGSRKFLEFYLLLLT